MPPVHEMQDLLHHQSGELLGPAAPSNSRSVWLNRVSIASFGSEQSRRQVAQGEQDQLCGGEEVVQSKPEHLGDVKRIEKLLNIPEGAGRVETKRGSVLVHDGAAHGSSER